MDRQRLIEQLDNYMNELNLLLHEPIIERDTDGVELDRLKAFFLLLPKLNGETWTEEMNTAALAVGAVHAAFDAHDAIRLTDATSKEQQLTVLSGDHYSGIHYRVLASQSNFGFIRTLSTTIGTINELKTNYHNKGLLDANSIIEFIQMAEAGCILDFLHTFNFTNYIPLVSTALPLTKIVQQSTAFREFENAETIEPIAILTKAMNSILDESTYLNSILLNELRIGSQQLYDKSI